MANPQPVEIRNREGSSERDEIAFIYPAGGMNGAGRSEKLGQNQYRRGINVMLKNEVLCTRMPVHVLGLTSKDPTADDRFRVGNIQGAKFFNPAKGQGGFSLSEEGPMILAACAGRKYAVRIIGKGATASAELEDLTNGLVSAANVHLVWWDTWENYALAQDGQGACWIWDAINPAFFSPGYNSIDKPASRVPNGATVMAYVHARGVVVVNRRQVLVGDSLHRTDSATARNLLEFVEQVYWATGQYFLPPSSMGNVTAAAVLPLKNTQHGHGELMLHCEDGIFSIDLNVHPRSSWANTPLTRHADLGAGATGPYALEVYDGDQFYRTLNGLTDLRSAAASSQDEGSPEMPLDEPVQTFLKADEPEWLRFCSMIGWRTARRLFCTIDPSLDGRFRWHRGIVVRNFRPSPGERTMASWEGVWTLPAQAAGIVQMVRGIFTGTNQRMFALCRGKDLRNRIVEFLPSELGYDILEDGTRERIRCQVITRAVDLSKPLLEKEYRSGTLFFRRARGGVEWGVWARRYGSSKWVHWRSGIIAVDETAGDGITGIEDFSGGIALGNFPASCETGQARSRQFEFLIRWKGYAEIEALRIMISPGDFTAEKVDASAFDIKRSEPLAADYSDFEYTDGPEWSISPPTL